MKYKFRNADALTAREHDVLDLVMTGMSLSEIARSLGLSINTVKFHKKHIYEKLGISQRFRMMGAPSVSALVALLAAGAEAPVRRAAPIDSKKAAEHASPMR